MPLHVSYYQTQHAVQDKEETSSSHDSYEDATSAIIAYMAERLGRYPNEQFHIILRGTRYDEKEDFLPITTDLSATLREYKEEITVGGKLCSIELQLDGTTNFGNAPLQIITLSDPELVETVRKAEEDAFVAKYGVCSACGDRRCLHDCGLLWCGCIDVCRGRCGADYDSDFDRYY